MKRFVWFIGGIVLATSVETTILAVASPGDLVFMDQSDTPVPLGAGAETTLRNFAVSSGCWDGPAAGLLAMSLNYQDKNIVDGQGKETVGKAFFATCRGLKTVAPGSLPDKQVTIIGKVK